MTNPAAQPRKVFLAFLVLAALVAIVVLMYMGRLMTALVVGVIAVALLIAAARPQGQRGPT